MMRIFVGWRGSESIQRKRMASWWLKGGLVLIMLLGVGWLARNFSVVVDRVFVFYPDRRLVATPAQAGLDHRDLWIDTADGQRLHGWLVEAGPKAPLLIFFHGNAGNIGDRVDNVARLVEAGITVLIFDYRGYGKSTGRPTEEGVYADGGAVYEYALGTLGYSPGDVVLFGRSLGTAVAAHLASRVEVAGVILESAFTNLKDLAWIHYPFLPGKFLVKGKFNVVEMVKGLKAPLLVVHGDRDGLVPMWMGEKVYQAAPEPKEFYVIQGAGHNDTDLVGGHPYFLRLRSFVYGVTGRET